MKFSKVRNVKSISRGTKGSAGLDFYVPTADERFLEDFSKLNSNISYQGNKEGKIEFFIPAHESVMIPSGIKVNIPTGKVLLGCNKSGIAVKKGLVLGAKVIDSDYQGEIFIHMINTKNETTYFSEEQKITQFILFDAWHGEAEEVDIENLYLSVSERGDGCLSSTGLN